MVVSACRFSLSGTSACWHQPEQSHQAGASIREPYLGTNIAIFAFVAFAASSSTVPYDMILAEQLCTHAGSLPAATLLAQRSQNSVGTGT